MASHGAHATIDGILSAHVSSRHTFRPRYSDKSFVKYVKCIAFELGSLAIRPADKEYKLSIFSAGVVSVKPGHLLASSCAVMISLS